MAEENMAWLGIDLGTQSVRALAVTGDGTVLGSGTTPLAGRREGGRHEQEPGQWWRAVCEASRAALAAVPGVRIGGLAVCGTSGTVLLTDGSGRPVSPALMYDDTRAAAEAARLREAGLAVQDTWALPKALWLTDAHGPGRVTHQPDVITARLVGRPVPTDSSHALKTAYDVRRETWPQAPGLPEGALPDVVRPGTRLGEVCPAAADATGIPAGTPVIAGMTDGCAAQIASGALRPGSWNSVLGTTLVLKGAAPAPVRDSTGVVYNHRAPDGTWLPGGASSVGAGALTAAFGDANPGALDRRAAAFEPSGLLTYPLVSPGERFPFRAPDATALRLGEPAEDADLWAGLLQGVAFTERLCLDYLHHLGAPLDGPLTFTGGGARSAYWNQLRADVLGRPARVPEQTEPALGMAALALHGTIGTPLAQTAERMVRIRTVVEPRPARTALFAEPYARLVDELTARGWLPDPVAAHTRTRLDRDTAGP
ncbi:sugar (pentulose or hexulose) kinase [Streptomyces sp. LBL]|uniref:FGGY-family carbohydrate kinase n=1 Tax=Streptomyces sp. LBL TaxID=2940562 RepID=UPI0024751F5F|nr:FGGY-family carbohydrate kinase [Streptomyces sp. LBL]MDH6623428.1 sugar (pentulose or hexulose) kinase [Streptomyces sp. LBL]